MNNIGLHHVETRRKFFTNVEPFPHPERARRLFDYLVFIIGTLSPLTLLPQVIAVYRLHSASGFSFTTWFLLALINVMWIIYGIIHRETPIWISNTGMLLCNGAIVVAILSFA